MKLPNRKNTKIGNPIDQIQRIENNPTATTKIGAPITLN